MKLTELQTDPTFKRSFFKVASKLMEPPFDLKFSFEHRRPGRGEDLPVLITGLAKTPAPDRTNFEVTAFADKSPKMVQLIIQRERGLDSRLTNDARVRNWRDKFIDTVAEPLGWKVTDSHQNNFNEVSNVMRVTLP